jgi:hypothetical protein
MRARNGWLFPLMVLAAGSVTVFGCIGIAAITGYLPLAKVSPLPLGGPVIARNAEPMTPALINEAQPGNTVAVAHTADRPGTAPAAAGAQASKVEPEPKKPSPQ